MVALFAKLNDNTHNYLLQDGLGTMTYPNKNISSLVNSFSVLSLKPFFEIDAVPDPILADAFVRLPSQWTLFRTVSKKFRRVVDEHVFLAYLNSQEAQADIRMPILSEKDRSTLFVQQQFEIDFLLKTKDKRLTERPQEKLRDMLVQLASLPSDRSAFALYVRHQCLNKIHQFAISCLVNAGGHLPKAECAYQYLTRFPTILFRLEELQLFWSSITVLDLSHNYFSSLPDFSHLKTLRVLNISHNQLTGFPGGCDKLQLVTLAASNNKIKVIPPGVGTNENMEMFDVHSNQLAIIPEDVPDNVLHCFDNDNCEDLTKMRVLSSQQPAEPRPSP